MRIISGKYCGRLLPSNIPKNVRPSTDIVRESIFNILSNYISFENIIVLDLYAGTGSLGFEALSRGANQVFFVDSNFKCINYIETAAKSLGIPTEKYCLFKSDCLRFLRNFNTSVNEGLFHLVFSDPPYQNKKSQFILEKLHNNRIIQTGGIVVLEHASDECISIASEFEIIKQKKFGITSFDILVYHS